MLFLALGLAVAGVAAGGLFSLRSETVACRGAVFSFEEGRDRFGLPRDPEGKVFYSDGVLTVAATKPTVVLRPLSTTPGPKPILGPKSLVLVTEGGPTNGIVRIRLKQRDGEKTVEAKAAWQDKTRIGFGLPATDFWQVASVTFEAGTSVPAPFRIRSLTCVTEESPAAALRLDVDTGSPLHVTTDAKNVALLLSNASEEKIDFEGTLTARGFFGDALALPVRGTLAGGATRRFPLDLSQAKPGGRLRGIWRVTGEIRACGTVAKSETRFAVLNRNVATPRLGPDKFKLGINYHMSRYAGLDRKLTLDALTACGANLVRAAGFSASACWKSSEKLDFSEADVQMRELKERGLALCTFCWPHATWMVPPEKADLPPRDIIRVRTKPGVMGRYAAKLAERFGSDIAYLETSNEADFWRDGAITAEEYVDYQKEVYTAVKGVCKDIQVLPSSWAEPDSNQPKVRRKGFLETVMTEAMGFYDAHPVHLHGGFGGYESSILTRLLPLRERLGITVPWFSSETALTCARGGEDSVARTVWMKILFAWAHGSVSYVWYNLRATGWKPTDPEQGYGLITADYYPRAGYAAFSALAHIASGLDFDRILTEEKGRHLYRFHGNRGGRPVVVLAGWDGSSDSSFPLRVRTDAVRAAVVDLMGNAVPAEKVEDGFVFPVANDPGALVLDGATFGEPYAEDLGNVPLPKVKAQACAAKIDGRGPDFWLKDVGKVHQLYEADPERVDRTWKGPDDLSAKIWIGREANDLRLRVVVTDDRHVQRNTAEQLYLGDGIQFILQSPFQSGNFEIGLARDPDGKPLVHTWIVPVGFVAARVTAAARLTTERTEGQTVYDLRLPLAAIGFDAAMLGNGFRFNCIVYDDDGRGKSRDNWIEIEPGIAGNKDYGRAPFVKVED